MERNRYADLLRVLAIGGVVYGHWLLVSVTYQHGQLSGVDALDIITWGRWVTWLFQVMPVFFLVGGYVNAQSWAAHYAAGERWTWWVRDRVMRLLWPTAVFVVVAVVAVSVALAAGAPAAEVTDAAWLVALQLWFLPVYMVLIALTPAMVAAHRRWGLLVPVVMAAASGLVDIGVTGHHVHAIGYLNYLFVWGSIHQWGFFWQDRSLTAKKWHLYALIAGGGALLAGLVTSRSFEPDMVGSGNTNPPSIALLAYAAVQVGLVLLAEPWGSRLLSNDRRWKLVKRLNAVVMNVYLWHFVPAIIIALAFYRTGLLPQPHVGSREWFALRLLWWAMLTAVLVPLVILVTQAERPMLRLPAGLGRPGPWSPLVLLAGIAVSSVSLIRLAIAGFAPNGRLPGLVLAGFAAGLLVTLFTGRAPAEDRQPEALPPDLPGQPAAAPRPVGLPALRWRRSHRLAIMPGRIRQEDIAAVRERSPIADVVGEYLQLRPAGGGHLKGLCPFHDERTPSFNVTPGKELYHCFSCGEGGDVIKFIMRMETLQFGEAVELLAARAGVELRYEAGGYVPGQETGQRRRLIEAHRLAQEFYSERMHGDSGRPAQSFLAERGFTLADADQFGMGYSPAAWDELTKHLKARGFTEDELLKAGLARKTSRGGLIDMFRGRLMWPIRDLTGETIAFGARKLNPEDDPKYLNTPETQIFKKGHVLYGADLAKREIAKRRQAVIVEGYTDVMACHLSGVPTAVATSGTSFGEDHVKILRRLIMDTDGSAGEVIFTFDGDAAGQKAALRAFTLEEKFVTQTFVAVQPEGLDPCDLRLKHGESAVRDLVARRVPLFEFAIRSVLGRHDLDTREGQFAAIDEAAPIIVRIKDRSKWKQYAVDLDRWIGFMDERYILDRVRGAAGAKGAAAAMRPARGATARSGASGAAQEGNGQRRANASQGEAGQQRAGQPYDRSDPVLRVEREALKLAVQWPALTGPEFDALGGAAFSVPVHAAVAGLIAACGGVGTAGRARDWASALLEAAPDDRARAFVTELATEPLQVSGEPDEKYADVILARVGELSVGREIAAIKAKLQRMNPEEDQAGYGRMFGDLVALEQRRKWLLDRATGA